MTPQTTPASTMTWPSADSSMIAQVGDLSREMEVEPEEVRTVRYLDTTMEVEGANREEEDDDRERSGVSGRGKGQDGKTRGL